MSTFKLQQFSVRQHDNAMKVCTDSLIFGALVPVNNVPRVLDIGGGTGLLSLMAAQRGAQHVTTVELIETSSQEAAYNVAQSPWHDSIDVITCDINYFTADEPFDLIISNPPFFDNHLKNDDKLRNTARHTDTLSYRQLLERAKSLLTPNGTIALLLPINSLTTIVEIAHSIDLVISKQTDLITTRGGTAKVAVIELVSLLRFSEATQSPSHTTLTVYESHQQYSEQSARLLQDFLLRFKQI